MFASAFAVSVPAKAQRWAPARGTCSAQRGVELRSRLAVSKRGASESSKFFGHRSGLRFEARSAPVTVDVPELLLITASATAGKPIISRAAVAWKAGAPLTIEEVEVAPPAAGEVRVKIAATGVCHTDRA
eukprot:tig00020830_g14425.t1